MLAPRRLPGRAGIILAELLVPKELNVTPGGTRGGGAVAAYIKGVHMQDLLWKMRLRQQRTLESYLQECAAQTLLARLPDASRKKI